MLTMNEVTLLGTAETGIQQEATPNGTTFSKFYLSQETTYNGKTKKSFYEIELFGKSQNCTVEKGDTVLVKGRITSNAFKDKNNNSRLSYNILGNFVTTEHAAPSAPPVEITADDLPF